MGKSSICLGYWIAVHQIPMSHASQGYDGDPLLAALDVLGQVYRWKENTP